MPRVQDPTQHGRLLSGLQTLMSDSALTDVTLVAGEEEAPCHRCVLAASSPYFRAMFTSDMSETHAGRVELHNVPPHLLAPIISYVYHGSVEITNDTVQDLMVTANLLELIELRDLCSQYMISELHLSNCAALFSLANTHHQEFIRRNAKEFIMKNFAEVSASGDLNAFSADDLLEIVSDDDLDIRSEEVVFQTIVKWVEHDLAGRKRHLPTLLKALRLGLLSEDFMSDVVEQCDLVMKDAFCRSMISLARLQVVAGGSVGFDEEDSDKCKLRYGMHCKKLVTFVGASQQKDVKGLGCFDPSTMKNYYAIQLHFGFDYTHRIDYHRLTVTEDNKIFVAGGILFENYELSRSGESSRDVAVFQPDTKSWIPKAPMNDRRCAHGLVTIGRKICAIGGKSCYPMGEPLATVEMYDIDSNTWSYTTDLPEGLCNHHAVAYDGKILVIGGFTKDGVTNTILQFDPLEQRWDDFGIKLEAKRAEHAAVIFDDKLYIVGGNNGKLKISSVEIVDLANKKWCRGPDFPEDRTSSAMFVVDGDIMLCGGMRTVRMRSTGQLKEMTSRDLWKYDPKEQMWTQLAKLVPYANTHGYVIAEHNIKKLVESEFVSKM